MPGTEKNRSFLSMFIKKTIPKMLLGTLLMGIGAAFGIFFYKSYATFFDSYNKSGVMLLSLFIAAPISVGALWVYFIPKTIKIGKFPAVSTVFLPISLSIFIAGALLREGFICILMALPIVIVAGLVGGLLGLLLGRSQKKLSGKTLSLFVITPLALGAAENTVTPPDAIGHIHRSIFIHTEQSTVWQHILAPTNIKPEELQQGIAYKIGVPYPIEATTPTPSVGGIRHLKWQRGVTFQEEITAFDENRHIAWKYLFTPASFPDGSLDDHIKIGGTYFNLLDTAYTLTPRKGGTQLDIDVTFRVTTTFNWYANLWVEYLIGDTAETILSFYKNRSEA